MDQSLHDLMIELFADEADQLTDDTPFRECEGWDSLKHVQLVVGIQSRFEVDLTAEEIARLTSKRRVRDVLRARGAA